MKHPFVKHEIEYIKKFDCFANHEIIDTVNRREDLPNRIRYHFKEDMVVAYFGSKWTGEDTDDWAIPPIVDNSLPDRTEMFWRYD